MELGNDPHIVRTLGYLVNEHASAMELGSVLPPPNGVDLNLVMEPADFDLAALMKLLGPVVSDSSGRTDRRRPDTQVHA